jgi:arginyl-tRNA synthetase
MSVAQEAKQKILQLIKTAAGKSYTPQVDDLMRPPQEEMGDAAFPCFALAKALKRSPQEVAIELAAKMEVGGWVKEIKAQGPYINFFYAPSFARAVLHEIEEQKSAYGTSVVGAQKSVMVEYAQPNTHKAIHVGHIRNFLVGQALVQLLRAQGFHVIPASYINDLGSHVAKVVWGIKKWHQEEEIAKEDRVAFLARVYAEVSQKTESDDAAKQEIAQVFQDLESLKGSFVALWRKTRKWSLDYFKTVFKELGLPVDVWYFESDLVAETKNIIEGLIQKGIAIHSDGAWLVDLHEEHLGVNLLVRSDGTLLYNAKDLALAMRKEEEYHPLQSLYVVDARQSLAQQQLFATLKRMGFSKDLAHVSYEFVTTKEGAMASRKGNVVLYEELRDHLITSACEETRKRHADWDEKKVLRTARTIAFAAMRFSMLRQDLDKKIVFDEKEALAFEGCTGPYLLYTYARIQSLLKKAKGKGKTDEAAPLTHALERALWTRLALFPEVVFEASKQYQPSLIAHYLFDLCQAFSAFYNDVPILQAQGEGRAARLALSQAVGQVLENGFALLGIEPVSQM